MYHVPFSWLKYCLDIFIFIIFLDTALFGTGIRTHRFHLLLVLKLWSHTECVELYKGIRNSVHS